MTIAGALLIAALVVYAFDQPVHPRRILSGFLTGSFLAFDFLLIRRCQTGTVRSTGNTVRTPDFKLRGESACCRPVLA